MHQEYGSATRAGLQLHTWVDPMNVEGLDIFHRSLRPVVTAALGRRALRSNSVLVCLGLLCAPRKNELSFTAPARTVDIESNTINNKRTNDEHQFGQRGINLGLQDSGKSAECDRKGI